MANRPDIIVIAAALRRKRRPAPAKPESDGLSALRAKCAELEAELAALRAKAKPGPAKPSDKPKTAKRQALAPG